MIASFIGKYVVSIAVSTAMGYIMSKGMKIAKKSINKRMPGKIKI